MKALFAQHKKTLILATLVLLLPILFGLIMWNRLPDPMPTHFNAAGEVDGWSSKTFAVFGLPLFLIACEWVYLLASSADPRRKNLSPKVLAIILWAVPAIGLAGCAVTYAHALGHPVNVSFIMTLLVGLMFIIVGNYLPKCRQTYTLGIKLPWTLADEENWNKTHRMAGPLWMLGGVVLMASSMLPGETAAIVLAIAIAMMVLVPTIYSFLLAKKKGQI